MLEQVGNSATMWQTQSGATTTRPRPLHCRAVWILDLDPVPRRPGSIGCGQPFQHDALQTEFAGVPEHGGAVLGGVLVERNAGGSARQLPRQLRLAVAQRQSPEILAVEFQQVERVQNRIGGRAPAVQRIEHGDAIGTRLALIAFTAGTVIGATTASPSMVKDLARSFPAADAMAG